MADVVVKGDTSGAVTLSAPAVAGTVTVTLPATSGTMLTTASTGVVTQAMLSTNVAGNGPAFSAYINSNQSVSANTFTKVQFNTEEFDTNNNFDPTTNYRFTPTVAGYYQFNSIVYISGAPTTFQVVFYKNGTLYKQAFYMNNLASTTAIMLGGSLLTYMNGSTDYIEVYINSQSATTIGGSAGSVYTQFSGAMVRSA